VNGLYAWIGIIIIVLGSAAGDCLLAYAMKRIGHVGELRRVRGLLHVVGRVLTSPAFLLGIGCMAIAFFSTLFALRFGDLSLVGPASASLTVIADSIFAKLFLHEHVDRRRWAAAVLVVGGVIMLAQ
jgi:uncharacterized membrane protein